MRTNFQKLAKTGKLMILTMVILPSLLTTSCSKDEFIDVESTEVENVDLKTSSCDFKDLLVETSWISGNIGDKDSFDADEVDGESWMDVYSSGVVMMKCKASDGHRTELKEESGDEASLDKYKKMKFTAKYTNLPENGVTIAQIHNRHDDVNRPWIRLYINSDRYIKIKETETTPDESSSKYTVHDDNAPRYTSGDEITVQVWTGLSGDKKGKITVTCNGEDWTTTLWPSNDWSSYSSKYYLKAGVYTEGNDNQATVNYSYFYINH